MTNKHDVMYEYMQQCPQFKDLFFNFGEAENSNTIIATDHSEYIVQAMLDGSAVKWYDFAVIQYFHLSTEPNSMENIDIMFDVEKVMAWVMEQEETGNYPDFGDQCDIMEIAVLQNAPTVAGQDQNGAKYMFSCRVEYLELWEMFYGLPTGSEAQRECLIVYPKAGGSADSFQAWKFKATLVLGAFNAVDKKITYDIKMAGDPTRGTVTVTDGTPTFVTAVA